MAKSKPIPSTPRAGGVYSVIGGVRLSKKGNALNILLFDVESISMHENGTAHLSIPISDVDSILTERGSEKREIIGEVRQYA